MIADINTSEIRPYFEYEQEDQNQFTWKGNSNDGFQQDLDLKHRAMMPLIMNSPNIVCWEQESGEFTGNQNTLYTLRFKDGGVVSSQNSELHLPEIPTDIYAWMQGYNFKFIGKAEICKVSPVNENTSFLIDGNDAEQINGNEGFIFEINQDVVDYEVSLDLRTRFRFTSKSSDGTKAVFVRPDINSQYYPYFMFSNNAIGKGFAEVRVLTDRPVRIMLINIGFSGPSYLYIDDHQIDIPEDPTY